MAIDERTARELLDQERRRLERAQASVDGDLDEERTGSSEELAKLDQHPAERGTEVSDVSRDLGLRADFVHLLEENRDAVRRLDEGRYGRCARCGEPIPDERLRAMPSARFCVEHQRAETAPATL